MSQICLYLDEDAMREALVVALRNGGIDVTTPREANTLSFTDEEQLIWATEHNRVLYSFNVGDFCRLHNVFLVQDRNHAGIILVTRQRYSVGQQLRGLLNLIAEKSAEEMMNQQVYLSSYIVNE
jgi:Tfp pilus assembly protein PilZ